MDPLGGQLELKLMAESGSFPAAADFVPIFHRWIETRRLPGELLIDVADYSHVHQGPGVVLVGHERSYSLDRREGRPGLACRQKRGKGGGAAPLPSLFHAALAASLLLEEEPAVRGLKFLTGEIRFRILDRLRAPGGERTAGSVMSELRPFLGRLYGGASRIGVRSLPPSKEPFEVRVRIDGAPGMPELVSRLASG